MRQKIPLPDLKYVHFLIYIELFILESERIASNVTCKSQHLLLNATDLSVKQCLKECDKLESKMFAISEAQDKAQEKRGLQCICYGKHITPKTCRTKLDYPYQLHRIVDAAEKVSCSCLNNKYWVKNLFAKALFD